jgi:PhnB protein
MIEVSPVLIFNGNCEEAFSFYKSVFGGEYQFIYRYEDLPDNGADNGCEKKILHVSLPLMKNVNLMGTDDMNPARRDAGGRVEIGLRLNDKDETFRLFEALSLGGNVVTPLNKTFYADYYGSVIDKFGVGWSFNCNIGREPAV